MEDFNDPWNTDNIISTEYFGDGLGGIPTNEHYHRMNSNRGQMALLAKRHLMHGIRAHPHRLRRRGGDLPLPDIGEIFTDYAKHHNISNADASRFYESHSQQIANLNANYLKQGNPDYRKYNISNVQYLSNLPKTLASYYEGYHKEMAPYEEYEKEYTPEKGKRVAEAFKRGVQTIVEDSVWRDALNTGDIVSSIIGKIPGVGSEVGQAVNIANKALHFLAPANTPEESINNFLDSIKKAQGGWFGGLVTTATKPIESYSQPYLDAIKSLAVEKERATLYGSFAYIAQKTPGDVDIQEEFEIVGSKDDLIDNFIEGIEKIVKNILHQKNITYSEFKVGLDPRYKLEIGEWINGKIKNYDGDFVRKQLKLLTKKGLLEKDDYEEAYKLASDNPTIDEWDELFGVLRKYYVLRWSANEILRGKKKLKGGATMTLKEAFEHKTMVKIDTIQWIEPVQKYVEVTNFYILAYTDKFISLPEKSKKISTHTDIIGTLLNLPEDYFDRVPLELAIEIEKFTYSKYWGPKPYKVCKRMWARARSIGDQEVIEKLTPIINSDIGYLGQINSDIEALIVLLEKSKHLDKNKIFKELDQMKLKLGSNTLIDKYILGRSLNLIDRLIKTLTTSKTSIHKLKDMKSVYSEIVSENTISEMKKVGLWPPPRSYFPEVPKYKLG